MENSQSCNEEINFYISYSKLMVSKLENIKECIIAWIEKLQDSCCGRIEDRYIYLKMLYTALKIRKLFRPFHSKPSKEFKLFELPEEILKNISSPKGVELFYEFHNVRETERVRAGGFPTYDTDSSKQEQKGNESQENSSVNSNAPDNFLIIRQRAGSNPKGHSCISQKKKSSPVKMKIQKFSKVLDPIEPKKHTVNEKTDETTDTPSFTNYCTPKRTCGQNVNLDSTPIRKTTRTIPEARRYLTPVFEPKPLPELPDSPAFMLLPQTTSPLTIAYDQMLPNARVPEFSSNSHQQTYYPSTYVQSVRTPVIRPVYSSARSPTRNESRVGTLYGSQKYAIPMTRRVRQDPLQYYSTRPQVSPQNSMYRSYYEDAPLSDTQRRFVVSEPRPDGTYESKKVSFKSVPESNKTQSSPQAGMYRVPNQQVYETPDEASFYPIVYEQIPAVDPNSDWTPYSLFDESTDYLLSTYPSIAELSDSVFLPTVDVARPIGGEYDAAATYTVAPRNIGATHTMIPRDVGATYTMSPRVFQTPIDAASNYETFLADRGMARATSTPLAHQKRMAATFGPRSGASKFAEEDVGTKCGGIDSDCSCQCPCSGEELFQKQRISGMSSADCPESCNTGTSTEKCSQTKTETDSLWKHSVRICENMEKCSGSSKRCRQDVVCRFSAD